MKNNFFEKSYDKQSIELRLKQLNSGKVGFYSVGLYPASLAYNCAMQTNQNNLLLAPRPGRDLLGAFSSELKETLDSHFVQKMEKMACHFEGSRKITYTLKDLLLNCELVVLSSNSKHIENDLKEACSLREELNRESVLIACLVGSFTYDKNSKSPTLLCQQYINLAFFSGFHRHGALRNPLDSFTANFCHPDPLNALLGARLLDTLSPNIQVSAGVHNVEGQYIKASKNISSIFAGFGHTFHSNNPGLLPTLLTLLLHQCLDQAAIVSMSRSDRDEIYSKNRLPLTEIGYGVQMIEAALSREGTMHKVRDHTFSQLTAMIADVKGSMMLPISGKPTRNFQVGQILARKMKEYERCPISLDELINWCELENLSLGALEGINSLKYWPEIIKKYSISYQDSSMINLLYMAIFSTEIIKDKIYNIMTNSRELTKFCQESVRPITSLRLNNVLSRFNDREVVDFISEIVLHKRFDSMSLDGLIKNTKDKEASSEDYSYNEFRNIFYNLVK
ncbi:MULTISPECIES: hypothetical protein [unclassified Prochlorococcus]|uniref:hypothetical protein n=1 Tax=unclassified Prochlorococcus TaxID=2627481 RepID=UPI000569B0F5|nr:MULTISPECIES: hypothetical protein [unclassified Prochlorococcus]